MFMDNNSLDTVKFTRRMHSHSNGIWFEICYNEQFSYAIFKHSVEHWSCNLITKVSGTAPLSDVTPIHVYCKVKGMGKAGYYRYAY